MEKVCKKCNMSKGISEFKFTDKARGYRQSYCKQCKNKDLEVKRRENPEKEALRMRNKKLRQKYKINQFEYLKMYEDQQGLCKICGKFESLLNVDHCHESLVVRGLLCARCNHGLGHFKDNSELLGRAILYLKETDTDKI